MENQRAVCPGEKLTFNCSIYVVNQTPHTVWSGFCADGSVVNIFHGFPTQESDTCGPFLVDATGSDGDCYTSTLTVTASPELNGTVILCSESTVEVGRATIVVNGKFCKLWTSIYVSAILDGFSLEDFLAIIMCELACMYKIISLMQS